MWGVVVLSGVCVWCEGSIVIAARSSSLVGVGMRVACGFIRVIGARGRVTTMMDWFRIGGIGIRRRVGKSGGSHFRVVDGMTLLVARLAGGGVSI